MTPLEPLYTLKVAAAMIPMTSVGTLRAWLYRHRTQFPARYQRIQYGRLIRLVSHNECIRIRSMTILYRVKPDPNVSPRAKPQYVRGLRP